MNTMDMFKTVLLVSLFFSFIITGLTYTMPSDSLNHIEMFSQVGNGIGMNESVSMVQDSLEQQSNIPVVELGALVFYSGNILMDLVLNFTFALPEMISLIINGVMTLFSVDTYLMYLVQVFTSSIMIILYFISIIQLITGVRSGRLV